MPTIKNYRYSHNRCQGGFTLIEFLIYSVIVTLMIGVIVLVGVNIMQTRARVETIEEVNHNAKIITNIITSHIRHAQEINLPAFNTTSTILSLQMETWEGIFEFKVNESGILTIKRGEDEPIPLNGEQVEVSFLEFHNVSQSTSTPGTVRMEMKIKRKNPTGKTEYDFERTFYTTENIRK